MTVLAVKSRTIAFETLSCNGEQVTIENDLDNEQQTLHFPILGTTAKGKVVALSSLRHLNYGNVISPQFPILIILDIIYAYYVEQNKYIREGMHDSTLCALEE